MIIILFAIELLRVDAVVHGLAAVSDCPNIVLRLACYIVAHGEQQIHRLKAALDDRQIALREPFRMDMQDNFRCGIKSVDDGHVLRAMLHVNNIALFFFKVSGHLTAKGRKQQIG